MASAARCLISFGMQQLVLRGEGWRITLHDVQMQWQPAALLRGELKVLRLSARQVEVLSLPSGKPPVIAGQPELATVAVSVLEMKIDSLSVSQQ